MTLAKIAAELRRTADQRPGRNCTHKLPRGLKLDIARRGDRLVLKAARGSGKKPPRPPCPPGNKPR